ncbi:MAG: heavy-metal-associated domain-containing protein [Ignavibacteriae bacterium]|nr:MAG: heavy-metal-associated domain-containing protein [Ignavibacteriota bacterium]
MKNLIKAKSVLIIVAVFAVMLNISETQAGNKKTTINIPTIQCGMCKKTITSVLKDIDGVKSVNVNMNTKKVSVKFDDTKTNIEALENAITAAGYDANDKKRDAAAYDNLHGCCKER